VLAYIKERHAIKAKSHPFTCELPIHTLWWMGFKFHWLA